MYIVLTINEVNCFSLNSYFPCAFKLLTTLKVKAYNILWEICNQEHVFQYSTSATLNLRSKKAKNKNSYYFKIKYQATP